MQTMHTMTILAHILDSKVFPRVQVSHNNERGKLSFFILTYEAHVGPNFDQHGLYILFKPKTLFHCYGREIKERPP